MIIFGLCLGAHKKNKTSIGEVLDLCLSCRIKFLIVLIIASIFLLVINLLINCFLNRVVLKFLIVMVTTSLVAQMVENLPSMWEIWVQSLGFEDPLVQFSSVTQSCPTLCDPMNHSMPGLPVHHKLPEFTQTHVHWVDDAIQPSHPLSSPSPPAPNPSQHQGLFKWVNSESDGQSIGISASASLLPMNTQDWSPLGWTGWISLQSKGLSRVFLNTTVQKHQFFGAQLSL